MGKKLAIRGHLMRGKEVIELLEMMGGKNIREHKYDGSSNMYSYYISNDIILNDRLSIIEDDDFIIFTLDEFLEKYPFYNGDKVFDIADGDPGIITAMKWDEDVSDMKYHVAFDNGDMGWYTNDAIGFLNEDNKEMKQDIETNQCKVNGLKRGDEYPIMEGVECNECIKYYFPEGYEFVNTDDTGVYLKPIKPKYPDNYEECVIIAKNIHGYDIHIDAPAYRGLMESFIKLLICCDAYWKIAGEELGLDKPWEPDWNSLDKKYNIYNYRGDIKYDYFTVIDRCLLVFPTEEMRDAFYENFKDLIEQCKELL